MAKKNENNTPGVVATPGVTEKTTDVVATPGVTEQPAEGVAESAGVLKLTTPDISTTSVAASPKKKEKTQEEKAKEYMDRLGVQEIYANTKGEFFTDKNYAILSEGGKKSKIKIFIK